MSISRTDKGLYDKGGRRLKKIVGWGALFNYVSLSIGRLIRYPTDEQSHGTMAVLHKLFLKGKVLSRTCNNRFS